MRYKLILLLGVGLVLVLLGAGLWGYGRRGTSSPSVATPSVTLSVPDRVSPLSPSSPRFTPTPTPTPSATPTPTPTWTPTWTPTPTPVLQVRDWLWLQEDGATTAALRAAAQNAAGEERIHLQVLLAQTLRRQGRVQGAIDIITALMADSATPATIRPFLILEQARLLRAQGRYSEAVGTLETWLSSATGVLVGRGYYELARLYRDQGMVDKAIDAYRRAVQHAGEVERRTWRYELAAYLAAEGRVTDALAAYMALADETQDPAARAQTLLTVGRLQLQLGNTAAAMEVFRQVLELAANTRQGRQPAQINRRAVSAAYDALRGLLANGQAVDDYTRGVIDVEAGAYAVAVQVLVRYLDTVEPHFGDAHAYLARALEGTGNALAAVEQWETLIATHPECPCWGDAWFNLARLYRRQGNRAQAYQVLQRLIRHPRASQALRARARLQAADDLVALGEEDTALPEYVRLAQEPVSPNIRYRAALTAAVLAYPVRADIGLTAVRVALAQDPPPVWADPLRYWEGRLLLAQGRQAEAVMVWRELATRRPLSYYAFRAAEQLQELGVDPGPWWTGQVPDAGAEVLPVPSRAVEVFLQQYTLSPAVRTALQRGAAYATVGLPVTADRYFRQAIAAIAEPDVLLALGETFIGMGMPHLGVQVGVRFLQVTGISLNEAPPQLWPLLYPTPARRFVEQVAAAYDVDPALLFAMMRQESRFLPWATSPAQAQGVMQLIPDTARYVARQMGVPAAAEELYRPVWNIPMGVFYFADALRRFGGQVPVALAVYNAGPGNAARWVQRWGEDLDVFLERIPFLETRTYLREVLRQAAVYRALYYCPRPTC